MNRYRRICLWSLALGVLTTVAIAWTSAAAVDLYHADPVARQFHSSGAAPAWTYSHWRSSTGEAVLSIDSSLSGAARTEEIAAGPAWSRTAMSPTSSQGGDYSARIEEARGWPMLALKSIHVSTDMSLTSWRTKWGVRLPMDSGMFNAPRTLGWRPIWPGFAVNVCLFGLAWGALLWLPASMVTRYRLRQGLCPRCAYPRPDGDTCPECGFQYPRSNRRA